MPTFSDYLQTKPMKDEQVSNIEHHAVMLCDALYVNKKNYIIKLHQNEIEKGKSVNYHQEQIYEINNHGIDTEFCIESGRKYHKIMMREGKSGSVHCFIDKTTGDVFKPASIKAPAKGVRFNLLDDNSRDEMFDRCDWAGGYLYAR